MACNGKPCASHKLLQAFTALLRLCLLAFFLHSISNHTFAISPSPSHSKSSFPSALSSDCDALQEVAASLSNASASAHRFFGLHWKPERDCCVWRGVTCGISSPPFSHSSRVVGLNLSDIRGDYPFGAATSLPRAVCQLSALTSLDLSYNGLVGAIPACFGHNLTSLHTLTLAHNFGLHSISPLANLSLLTHLDLSWIFLDTSNSSFSTLSFPNLTYLDLSDSGASLSGASLPLGLHNPRLQYLNLQGIFVPCSNLSFISGLSDLHYLSFAVNSLSIGASSAAWLSTTPLLRYLDILSDLSLFNPGKLQIDAGGVRALQCLPHLEVLMMQDVSVSASNLKSLVCRLSSLKQLYLVGDRVEVQRISDSSDAVNYSLYIDRLPCEKPASVGLAELCLYEQGFTGPFPAWVRDFTRLGVLGLEGNSFQGPIPQEWLALTHLTFLYLPSGEFPSTPVPLSQKTQNWLFRLPLETLTLSSIGLQFPNMQCEGGFSLLNRTLKVLDLSDNYFSASLWHCLQHHNFSRLQFLDLSNNPLALQLKPPVPRFVRQLDLSFCQLSGSLSMDLFPRSASPLDLSPRLAFPLGYLEISFAHNNLVGNLPSQIGTLGSALLSLDLSYNKLTGPIPSSFWNLSGSGQVLLLDNNHLYGEIFPSPPLNTEVLSVANNYLSKASFHNVSEDVNSLDLSFNQLQGSLEDLLGDYSLLRGGLVILLLFGNQLTGSMPTSLGTLAPSLMTIDLSHNKLTGSIPHSLEQLQALQSNRVGFAAVGYTMYSDTYALDSVKNLKSFVPTYLRGHLDVSFNNLSGCIPEGLGALLGLNDLILSNNQLSGPIPPDLAHLVYLETLDLSYNNLQGTIPAGLSNLTCLAVFNVSFNPELSGLIPDGPQLETIASYEGDDRLCGQVVHRDCGEEQKPVATEEPNVGKTREKESIKEKISSGLRRFEEWVAIPGICVGYVLGVGLTIWGLKLLHFYK